MDNHSLSIINEDKPWYKDGLHFKCTECGQCCTGAPGYTWVTDDEIAAFASHFKLSIEEFGKRYLRFAYDRYALLERPNSYDCIFLKDNKCTVYALRPVQCRTFPWWHHNLASPEDWKEAASYCEGISTSAPLVSYEAIQDQLNQPNNI